MNAPAKPRRFRRIRWVLLGVLVLGFATRAALPTILERSIASFGSAALGAPVRVSNVDLDVLRGGVGLFGLVVEGRDGEPAIELDRFFVDLGWIALLERRVHLERIEIGGPVVRLERLDGVVRPRLTTAAPSPETPEPVEPAADPGAAWTISIDSLHLDSGNLAFRDEDLASHPTLVADLERIEIDDVRFDPAGPAGQLTVELAGRVEGAPVGLHAEIRIDDERVAVRGSFEAEGIPIERFGSYGAPKSWEGLGGRLHASLRYRLEPGTRHDLEGTVALRDVKVRVGASKSPVLALESLLVSLDRLDLDRRSAHVGSVVLRAPRLVLDADRSPPLLVLPVTQPAGEPAPPPPVTPAPAPASDARPFTWRVDEFRLEQGVVRVLPELEVALEVTATEVRPEGFPLVITARVGEGELRVEGDVALEPLSVKVVAAWRELALPGLATAAGRRELDRVSTAKTEGRLEVAHDDAGTTVSGTIAVADVRSPARTTPEVGLELGRAELDLDAVSVTPSGTRVRGRLRLDDFALEGGADPFRISFAALEADLGELTSAGSDVVVTLDRVRLVEPVVRVTVDETGVVLPGEFRGEGGPPLAEVAAAEPAPEVATPAELPSSPPLADVTPPVPDGPPALPEPVPGPTEDLATAPGAPPAPPAPPVERTITLRVLEATIEGGVVRVLDRTLDPEVETRIVDVTLEGTALAWPEPSAERVVLTLRLESGGSLSIDAVVAPDDVTAEIDLSRLALSPIDPYARKHSGYGLSGGTASLETTIRYRGPSIDADSSVTLVRPGIRGAEGAFRSRFGVPLDLAIALLQDPRGEIRLSLPVKVREGATEIDFLEILGGALRQAIVGALSTPLKLVGALVPGGKKSAVGELAPIRFQAGSSAEVPGEGGLLARLGALLGERPGLAIVTVPRVTDVDRRQLREAKLLAELEGEAVSEEADLRQYLSARSYGLEAALPAERLVALEARLAEVRLKRSALATLAAERVARVREIIERAAGIEGERILGEPAELDATGEPSVELRFRVGDG